MKKQLILLMDEYGHTHAEIGRILNMSRQSVNKIVSARDDVMDNSVRCIVCREPTVSKFPIGSKNYPMCDKCESRLILRFQKRRSKWSKKYAECRFCHTTREPHHAKGLCKRCYEIARRLKNSSA